MPLIPEEEAQGERIASVYNSAPWAETNRWGLGRAGAGGKGLFIAAIRDFAGFGRGVVRVSSEALVTLQARLDDHATLLDRLKAATAAAANGPVFSVNGMGGAVVLPDVPKVLPPIVTQPVAGSTPSLTGGALMLAVDRLTSLYGEAQKTIRFQISTVSTFATTVYDSGVLTQAAVSASLANAQAALTGGTTYYVRAIQTDAKDVSSGWSAPVSFVFPRLPNAPVMSAPANNATNVGAQNATITLTAGAYSHPNGTAQASRRFELSKDNFATIVTVNGTAGQASATISSPKDVLTANTAWKVRCVDTDANGGSATGAATTFTTTAAYRTSPGEPDSGGFKGFNDFGDGLLWDLIVAPKSTEVSNTRAWNGPETSLRSVYSRLNGPANTDGASSGGTASNSAQLYCRSISLSGAACHLWAVDEAKAIASKLRASVATVAAFQSGGSEQFGASNESSAVWMTSTELTSSNIMGVDMMNGSDVPSRAKTETSRVRPIKRVAATMPYAIGTAMEGGYLAAYFTDLSSGTPVTYMLIVADKGTEVTRAYQTNTSVNGFASRTARQEANGGALPAFDYCFNLVSGGKDDWYLPAIDQLLAIRRMDANLPTVQRYGSNPFWSSTEVDANLAKISDNPNENGVNKAGVYGVRAVRQVLLAA